MEFLGEFANRGGFAATVDTDEQDDMGAVGRRDGERPRRRRQDLGDVRGQCRAHLVAIDLLVEAVLGQGGGQTAAVATPRSAVTSTSSSASNAWSSRRRRVNTSVMPVLRRRDDLAEAVAQALQPAAHAATASSAMVAVTPSAVVPVTFARTARRAGRCRAN